MVTTQDTFLTTQEAAKFLGISKCSVYRWLKRGWIVGIILPNKTIRISQASLDNILSGR